MHAAFVSIGLERDDLGVALDREDQRHIDVRALRDHRLNRGQASRRGGDLHHHVWPCRAPAQGARSRDRAVRVAGDLGRNLDAHEAVATALTVIDRPQHVGRRLHVFKQQVPNDRFSVLTGVEAPRDVVRIGVRARQRLCKNRRIRGHAGHTEVAIARKLSGLDHGSVDVVEPDALAQPPQFSNRVCFFHVIPLNYHNVARSPFTPILAGWPIWTPPQEFASSCPWQRRWACGSRRMPRTRL